MGTEVRIVSYTTPQLSADRIGEAARAALTEIRRLESLMSSWRDDTDIGRINAQPGAAVKVSPETLEVFEKAQWASELSGGAFDVSFNAMADTWKFGDAAEDPPKLPDPAVVRVRRALIDYRRVRLDPAAHTVTIGEGMRVGLGGIAKGDAVDRAAAVLARHGVRSFLLQAGGDLFGRGKKPGGAPWVSGIQDPRGPRGSFFATIQLDDHAFSTAGDYARAFVLGNRRYHHIIDPRTGYPATACRSVTVWAPSAFVADAVGLCLQVENPAVWVYPEGLEDDLTHMSEA
jgi:thiamine biosynthesis lipoprotein